MYSVTKRIDFCYGHRLLDYRGKCQHLHGHNGRLEIELSSEGLDQRGMVRDFHEIKEMIQRWIDTHLDHKMILREDDPALPSLRRLGEPCFTMADNPTAEALARLIYGMATGLGLPVTAVRLWETPGAFATYQPPSSGPARGSLRGRRAARSQPRRARRQVAPAS